MPTDVLKRRFTVDDYYRMAQAGILGPEDRVELIEGEIVEMSPIGKEHASCVKRIHHLFSERLRKRVLVSVQDPIRLGERSEPEPDIALLRVRDDFYAGGHPGPDDIHLLVEVADTTQDYDRGVKKDLYAKAGIQEAWLVDIPARRIEVYRRPAAGRYDDVRHVGLGQTLSPLAFPECVVGVDEVLGSHQES
jgi:Uma2 family endonuclease